MFSSKILAVGTLGILLAVGLTRITYSMIQGAPVLVDDKGADPAGVNDSTLAFQAALNTGRTVVGKSGATYLVNGGLTQSTAGQVVDFSGSIIKLKNAATLKGILRLNGAGAVVRGGEWDLNVANNLSDTNSGYNTWAVLLAADSTVAERMYVHDSYGIAIKALAGVNHVAVRSNRVIHTGVIANGVFAIYFDNPAGATEVFGNSVIGNYIDVSAVKEATAVGIFSGVPVVTGQHRCLVQGNEVIGSTDALTTGVGLTVRGMDCVVTENTVSGFTIGISVDPAQETRTVISNNQVRGATGTGGAIGIESNGARAVITNNYVDGGTTGIGGSTQVQASASLNAVTIVGNSLKNQSSSGIFIQAVGGITANHLTIASNTITNATATPVAGIRLSGDCRYALISGNTLDGPGSAVANARGVYLDSVNSDVTISGNRFSNWERAATVFNAGAVAQDRIQFIGNDVANGIPSNGGATLLSLEGAATWGVGTRVSGNVRGSSGVFIDEYLDRALPIRILEDNNFTTPESNVTAGIGSMYISAANGRLWTKIAGTGNTGWMGLTDRATVALVAGSATATVVGTFCTCTDGTAAAAVKCPAPVAGTLTITGTGTDSVTYICVK
jgi:hypothetical protein